MVCSCLQNKNVPHILTWTDAHNMQLSDKQKAAENTTLFSIPQISPTFKNQMVNQSLITQQPFSACFSPIFHLVPLDLSGCPLLPHPNVLLCITALTLMPLLRLL
jgi:hypothetical protein